LIPIRDFFSQAVDAFGRGDLTQAANLCALMPISASNYADSRHLAAVIAGRQGDVRRAVAYIVEFLSLSPADADAWSDFAVIAGNGGLQRSALDAAFRAVHLEPDRVEWWKNAALLASATHRHDLALSAWEIFTGHQPLQVDSWYQRALSEIELGRTEDAIASLAQVTRLDPGHFNAYEHLGRLLYDAKRFAEAGYAYREVTRLCPDNANAYFYYGASLLELGGHEDATFICAQSLALDPKSFGPYNNLSVTLFLAQLDFARAYPLFDRAYRLNPASDDVQTNLAVVLQGLGQTEEARQAYCRAAVLSPDAAVNLYNQSLTELAFGNFRDGWRFYEWRRFANIGLMAHFDEPLWRGEDIRGRHIFITDEQGLGDTLQFCRFVPMVRDLGAKVTLCVKPALLALLTGFASDIDVITESTPRPRVDCWAHLMSLPYLLQNPTEPIFGTTPYLAAQPEKIDQWQARLGPKTKRRIGITWSGSSAHKANHYRSIPLTDLSKLLARPDCEFHVLQWPVAEEDAAYLQQFGNVIIHPDELMRFPDTAALMMHLDLIISVDTSIVHLSGALGRPTFVLLAVNADWRWLLNRRDSPWYSSHRLYRQRDIGQWDDVLAEVLSDLNGLL
jgi:tetratricopeptide (TPR) repeat protein/ADP-heptose:LPS heptosyltransferase